MGALTLAIRHNEYWEWADRLETNEGQDIYAVARIGTPFPLEPCHPETQPLAIIAMGRYATTEGKRPGEPLWGWIHLDDFTKEEVGRRLQEMDAQVGRWYFLRLRPATADELAAALKEQLK